MLKGILLGMALTTTVLCHAQTDKMQDDFDSWRNEIAQDFNKFRKDIMNDYLEFVRKSWKEYGGKEPDPIPKEDSRPPKVTPKDDKVKPVPVMPKPLPILIRDIVKPIEFDPQPIPLIPIEPVKIDWDESKEFSFFGTKDKVKVTDDYEYEIKGCDENAIADALKVLSDQKFDNLIDDCLKIRKERQLCDWAFLLMLKEVSEAICGEGTNEAELLKAYIFMRAGYKMRLAMGDSKLYMLFASKHHIYNREHFILDGEKYYGLTRLPASLKISQASFKKEQPLSLQIPASPKLDEALSDGRKVSGIRYPKADIAVHVNKNLIDFYSTYPASMINDNFCTKWALYANTPMAENIKKEIYPQIKNFTEGLSQYEAINRILNVIQTGLVYEYDSKVWGYDRAFFAEESLYYPYCDCEDRSILLTRIIRDILGLKCLLVYYPGHLAAAIEIADGSARGDYIEYNGHKYTIADGTIIGYGANAGITMDGMDNANATVILLD